MTEQPADAGARPLSDEEQRAIINQFEDLRSRSQQAFDEALRTIAAGAVAVTATLTAAFEGSGLSGTLAVALSVASLVVNLVSFWTPQLDASVTIDRAWKRDRRGVYESGWRQVTGWLNALAFFLLVAAGICLTIFVSSVS